MIWKHKKFYQETNTDDCIKPLLVDVTVDYKDYTYHWNLLNHPFIVLDCQYSLDGITWFTAGFVSNPGLVANIGSATFFILGSPTYFRINAESQNRNCGMLLTNVIDLTYYP